MIVKQWLLIIGLTAGLISISYGDVVQDMVTRVEANSSKIKSMQAKYTVYLTMGEKVATNKAAIYQKGNKSRTDYLSYPSYSVFKIGTNISYTTPKLTNMTGYSVRPPAASSGIGFNNSPFQGFDIQLGEVNGSLATVVGIKNAGCQTCVNNPALVKRVYQVDFVKGIVNTIQDYDANNQNIGTMSMVYTNISGIYVPVNVKTTAPLPQMNLTGYIDIYIYGIKVNQAIDDSIFINQ